MRNTDPADVGDRNVERLLGAAYKPEDADADFARRLTGSLCAAARDLATERAATSTVTAADERRHVLRRRLGWAMGLAASVAAVALVFYAAQRRSGVPHGPAAQDEPGKAQPPVRHASHPADTGPGLAPRARPDAPTVTPLALGASLTTRAGERRRVTLTDGSVLYLNQNTQVTQTAPRRLLLTTGEVYVEVAPREQGSGATFVVHTESRKVAALGTRFAVRAERAGTGVLVTQGQVQVSGLKQLLQAGQQVAAGEREIAPAPRASAALDWTRELMAAAESPLVPCSRHAGGALLAVDPSGQEIKLTLRKFHVDVHIEDGFARTTIDQTYFNNESGRLEGTFYFPLPPDASLSRLAMYVAEGGQARLMEGGMAERDHARGVFESIRHARRDPALLEWVDGSTFKMRVFPLEGRQEKRIILSYTQRLASLYGVTRYRFPGGHNMDLVKEWSFQARVKHGAAQACSSPTHPAMTLTPQKGDMVLSLKTQNVKPDRDVALEIVDKLPTAAREEAARFSGFVHENHDYLMLRYVPKLAGAPRRERRDWVILFESGANRDPLLARAQIEVIRTLLTNAEHDDTFHLLTAATRTHTFRDTASPATAANVEAACKFLDNAHLIGALDLAGALKTVAPLLKAGKNPYLLHVGGGMAAVGERGEDALAKLIPDGVRYVGVGVGKRWGRAFMKAAADRTGGYFTQINPDEPIAWRAFDLLATLDTPRLMQLRVVDDAERAPFLCDAASLAQGEEVCAVTRVKKGTPLPETVTIAGKLDGQPFVRKVRVQNVAAGAGYLPRTWAKLEIDRLLAEDGTKHKKAVIELSKAMYVMSPYTSLLVLETEADYAKYNVDRGRKDHWAMYACAARIPIVHEPQGAPAPVAAPGKDGKRPVGEVLGTVLIRVPVQALTLPGQPNVNAVHALTALHLYAGAHAIPIIPDGGTVWMGGAQVPMLSMNGIVGRLGQPGDWRLRTWQEGMASVVPGIGNLTTATTGTRPMAPRGGPGPVQFAPVFVSPSMQWAVPPGMYDNGRPPQGSFNGLMYANPYQTMMSGLPNPYFGMGGMGGGMGMPGMGMGGMGMGGMYGGMGGMGGGMGMPGMGMGGMGGMYGGMGGMGGGWGGLPASNYPLSPALNLLQGRNSSVNYYLGVMPDQTRGGTLGVVDRTTLLSAFDSSRPVTFKAGQGKDSPPELSAVVIRAHNKKDLEAVVKVIESIRSRGEGLSRDKLDMYEAYLRRVYDPKSVTKDPGKDFKTLAPRERTESLPELAGLLLRDDRPAVEREIQRLIRFAAERDIASSANPTQPMPDSRIANHTGRGRLRHLAEGWGRLSTRERLHAMAEVAELTRGLSPAHQEAVRDYFRKLDATGKPGEIRKEPLALADVEALAVEFTRRVNGQGQRALLYERPVFSGDARFFGDLVSRAPGLNTTTTDIQAVLEAEAVTGPRSLPGAIDERARALIDRARSGSWQALRLPARGKQADSQLVFNAAGHYALDHILSNGLREIVVCDGMTLLHLYPELGLGGRRVVSRFHRADFTDLVPWLLPPTADLALGADLKYVDEHTVAVRPRGADARRDSAGQPIPYAQMTLRFAADGRLTERQVVLMPAGKTLSRETYSTDGTVRLYRGEDVKAVAERKFNVAPAAAPNLTPDTHALVLVPMPLRTREHCGANGRSYADLTEQTAIAQLVAEGLQGHGHLALQLFGERFHARGDRRLGFYTLLTAAGVQINPAQVHLWNGQRVQMDIVCEHPKSPLAMYLAYHNDMLVNGDRSELGKLDGPADGFVQRLATFRDLLRTWHVGRGSGGQAAEAGTKADCEALLAFVKTAPPLYTWALADATLGKRGPRGGGAFQQALAAARRRAGESLGLGYAGRYEQARTLLAVGEGAQARAAFRQLHTDALMVGVLPPIDTSFRDALSKPASGQTDWRECLRQAAAKAVKASSPGIALGLAWQAHQLGDPLLAEELFKIALDAAAPGDEHRLVALASVEYLLEIGQHVRAGERLEALLKDEKIGRSARLWRLAASLATKRRLPGRAALCLEKALDLEYHNLPDVVHLEAFRADYSGLLNQYQQMATAMTILDRAAPQEFVVKVVRVADRWRAVDPDGTAACQAAGKILRTVGAADLAWDYLTTPIGLKPNEAAPWVGLAQTLRGEGELELADRAYATAFESERTNAQILWDRAQNLQQAGRMEEARRVLRELANGNWQQRFQPLRQQALTQLQAQ